mgnify:FL=1
MMMNQRVTPSVTVQLTKGYHEYMMPLNQKEVKMALDRFYGAINARNAKYRICGTRVARRGNRANFIVCYEIL